MDETPRLFSAKTAETLFAQCSILTRVNWSAITVLFMFAVYEYTVELTELHWSFKILLAFIILLPAFACYVSNLSFSSTQTNPYWQIAQTVCLGTCVVWSVFLLTKSGAVSWPEVVVAVLVVVLMWANFVCVGQLGRYQNIAAQQRTIQKRLLRAYGIGPLENYYGRQWCQSFEARNGMGYIENTLTAAISVQYLDLVLASEALAAMETLKRLGSADSIEKSGFVVFDSWIHQQGRTVLSQKYLHLCNSVTNRILGDASELRELWYQLPEFERWHRSVLELRLALKTENTPL
ncbi:DUF4259 domain-containing protein [Oleiphilus messinensis]|nr:DUF4259 domain-containing protein [Oleiphilus messinensis]